VSKNSSVPVVSIGMPVYNNVGTVTDAIQKVLDQTFSDFELIISDNASTDGTESICRSFADKDNRIVYKRQKENTGLYNFIYLFEQATAEFFMWAPAHYSRSVDFIERSLDVLRQNPKCTFAATPNCWVGEEGCPEKFQDFSYQGTVYERVSKYLSMYMHSHACFYALFRRSEMKDVSSLSDYYIAFDNVFIVKQLMNGEFKRSNTGLLVIGKGQSANPDYIATIQTRPIHYILPIYDFSKNIMAMVIDSKSIVRHEKIFLLFKLFIENMKVYKMITRYWVVKIMKKVGIYGLIRKN
jgi:hypothetical protein